VIPPEVVSDDDSPSPEMDADYMAYLESLGNEEAERMAFLESLGEPERRREWWEEKEKITWHPNHQRGDNWHDYLLCRCRACTSFRKANDIKSWAEEHLGEPDPWGDSES
jgi:hypothetical protein